MNQKRESMASQRFSRALDRTDRASRAMGIRSSIYMGSSFDLHWKKDEEDWFTTSLSSESPTIESPSSEAPLRKTAPLKEKTKEKEPPPADKGRRAYLFMLSAFIIEAIMWGIPLTSSGVFTRFYNEQPGFNHNRYIAVIGTLGTGIPFLGAPLITPLTSRWHKYQSHMIWSGWFICTLALIAASFSKTVWQLILTQGLLYGIGFLILYYAMLSMLNEWFVERRGLAYGILFAAAGLSGTGLPFLAEACLRRFGYAATLRGFAVTLVVCVGPMLPFCRGRLTPQEDVQATTVSFRKVLTNPLFYFFSISNLFQGLGFYLPSLYVGIFSDSLKVSSSKGVIVICLLNLSQVLSQIAIGWLSDCTNIFALLLLSSIGSAIFGCVLWYVASGFGHLVAFALTYGLFAGGYTVLYTRFCSACADDPPTTLWLYGIFAFERGIGNVVAGPISAALLHRFQRQLNSTHSSYAYRELGLFVGACMLASALGAFGYFWRGYALGPGRIAVQGLVRRKTNWKSGERPKIALQRPKSVVHYREDYNFDEGRPF